MKRRTWRANFQSGVVQQRELEVHPFFFGDKRNFLYYTKLQDGIDNVMAHEVQYYYKNKDVEVKYKMIKNYYKYLFKNLKETIL